MKNTMLVFLLALAAFLSAGCGKKAAPPPAQTPAPSAEMAEPDDAAYDEAPNLDEEGSREW